MPNIDSVFNHVKHLQNLFFDKRNCTERRRCRMPFQLRCTYARLSKTLHEHERQRLQRQAWLLRKDWVARMRTSKQNRHIDSGYVVLKPKRLHLLESIEVPQDDGQPDQELFDASSWERSLVDTFEQKWGSHMLQQRLNCIDFVLGAEDAAVNLDVTQVDVALSRIKRPHRLDFDGLSVVAFILVVLRLVVLFW